MPNELILIFSVVFIYGAALLGYKFFGKTRDARIIRGVFENTAFIDGIIVSVALGV